jgi:hypothetical protein
MRWMIAVTVLLCGMGGMDTSALGQGTFTLEFRDATPQQDPALGETMRMCSRSAAPPAEIKAPQGLPRQVTYFRFGPPDSPPLWLIAVSGDKPVLYADVDRTGDFSKATVIAGKRDESCTWFEPVTLTVSDGRKVRVRFMSHSNKSVEPLGCLHAVPAGYRTGKVKLGEKVYAVALIDGNLNGLYNDPLVGPYQGENMDALAVDRNSDGKFDGFNPDKPAPEWSPLAKGLAADGKFYTVTVAADGSQIEIAAAQPKYGNLDLGPHQVNLTAFSDFGLLRIEAKGRAASIPAGRYSTVSGGLVANDGKDDWRLQLGRESGPAAAFTVSADETLSLPLGPPFVPSAKVTQSEREVTIEYVLQGRSGETYDARSVLKGSTRLQPPRLEVTDSSGKIIYTAAFEFG